MAFLRKLKMLLFDTSLFRLCYLSIYFLYMITYLSNNIYMRGAIVLFTLWGTVISVYTLIKAKSYLRVVYGFWLGAFLLSFVITIITQIGSDWYAFGFNVFLLLQTFICFLLFYGMHSERGLLFRFEMYLFVRFFVYASTIAAIIGIVLMFFGVPQVFYGNTFTGVYMNPNFQGFVAAIAVVFCHMLIKPDFLNRSGQKRVSSIWIASCAILNLTVLILSDSNASILFLGAYAAIFVFMRLIAMVEDLTPAKVIFRVVALLLIGVLLLYLLMFIRTVFRVGIAAVTASDGELSRADISKLTQNSFFSFISDSGLNSRISLWDAGLKIFTMFPVFGAGKGDLYRLIVEVSGDRSYFTTDYFTNILIADMHNGYYSVLVTTGVIGFILFMIFMVRFVFRLSLPVWFVQRRIMNNSVYPSLLALFGAYLVYSLVERTFLFTDSFFIIIFWLILGYISCFAIESGYNNRGKVTIHKITLPKTIF